MGASWPKLRAAPQEGFPSSVLHQALESLPLTSCLKCILEKMFEMTLGADMGLPVFYFLITINIYHHKNHLKTKNVGKM